MMFSATHLSPSLSPVPGSAASRPDLTVLVAGGASLHLHVAPGERGDLRRRHVYVTPPAGIWKKKIYQSFIVHGELISGMSKTSRLTLFFLRTCGKCILI